MNQISIRDTENSFMKNLMNSGEVKDVIVNYRTGPYERVRFTNYKNKNINIHITKRK